MIICAKSSPFKLVAVALHTLPSGTLRVLYATNGENEAGLPRRLVKRYGMARKKQEEIDISADE